MRKVTIVEQSKVEVEGVEGFFEKEVTKFGTGAKIDCPRQYLGRAVYVIIRRPGARVDRRAGRRRRRLANGGGSR